LKIEIDKIQLNKPKVDTEELIGLLSTGKAILFTGAGFSKLTKDINQEEPSLAKDLAKEICRLGDHPEDEDLRYATDLYLESAGSKEKLIRLLKEKYTLQSTNKVHDDICSVNWRRFYTTNYDKTVEIASANAGKVVECIDVSFPASTYYKRNGICVHLNGSIDSLNEESLDSDFKLSTSSYISPDSFLNSDWYYYFKKDLERSSAVVFAGYSMYDIEIQRILFENKSLRDKTYFITQENPLPKTEFTLSKFGNIVPVGIDGFAKLINDHSAMLAGDVTENNFQAIALYEVSNKEIEIRDSDVETMIMYGNIDNHFIDDGITSAQRVPYLIVRDSLELIKRFIDENKNIVLYGDMGNGKSMLLRELQAYLSMSSIESYHIVDWEGDYIGDIDLLAKSERKAVINIDGYERYLDLITHYSKSMPTNINLIVTSRTAEHERLRPTLKDLNFEYNELCIDILSGAESVALVEIIDNLGMWGEKAGLSQDRKVKLIENNNYSQISLTLLALFDAPQMRDRISSALEALVSDSETKDTIFSIALIEILDVPCKHSLISDLAANDKIYSSDLLDHKSFKDLFQVSGLEIKTKSSLFCLSLIRGHFSSAYVTSQLQKIAKNFNKKNRDNEQNVIFKSTLRFSFVERLLSEENKKGNLRRYYEGLKVSVPWLKNDPHFWLQYGMANITFKEYQKAQQFLDQAYAIAASKDQYYTSNIDTQQARLFILVAMGQQDRAVSFSEFLKGHSLLDKLDNDVYKFRQVEKYRDYYESCFSMLSKGNKVGFQRACQKMRRSIDNAVDNGEINLSQQSSTQRAQTNLDYILSSIEKANQKE